MRKRGYDDKSPWQAKKRAKTRRANKIAKQTRKRNRRS